jgi:hypothetical protein
MLSPAILACCLTQTCGIDGLANAGVHVLYYGSHAAGAAGSACPTMHHHASPITLLLRVALCITRCDLLLETQEQFGAIVLLPCNACQPSSHLCIPLQILHYHACLSVTDKQTDHVTQVRLRSSTWPLSGWCVRWALTASTPQPTHHGPTHPQQSGTTRCALNSLCSATAG